MLVSYLLRGREANEIDGLRRAFGSSEIDRIVPHLTVLPPVNIDGGLVSLACAQIEEAVCGCDPIEIGLSGVETFAPDHHVIYFRVTGETDRLDWLREACNTGVLQTTSRRPYVAHVTLRSHADPVLVAVAKRLLKDFTMSLTVDQLGILRIDETSSDRRWVCVDEIVLGSKFTSGRGGREIVLTRATIVGPRDVALLLRNNVEAGDREPGREMVIRASIEGELIGLVLVHNHGELLEITNLVVDHTHRRQGVARQLIGYLERCAIELGCREVYADLRPDDAAFFLVNGFVMSVARSHRSDLVRVLRSQTQ